MNTSIQKRIADRNRFKFRKEKDSYGGVALYENAFNLQGDQLAKSNLGGAQLEGIDDAEKSIPFIVNTINEDRDGDIVVPTGAVLDNYQRNPVVFFGHQSWEIPIAKAVSPQGDFEFYIEPKQQRSRAYFDTSDSDAMFIYDKVKRGYLSGASIAFVPLISHLRTDSHYKKSNPGISLAEQEDLGPWVFESYEVTEWSVVGVPSNAGALRDVYDREKSYITPYLQKALLPYCAKGKVCFNGICYPCNQQEETMSKKHSRKRFVKRKAQTQQKKAGDCGCTKQKSSAKTQTKRPATCAQKKKALLLKEGYSPEGASAIASVMCADERKNLAGHVEVAKFLGIKKMPGQGMLTSSGNMGGYNVPPDSMMKQGGLDEEVAQEDPAQQAIEMAKAKHGAKVIAKFRDYIQKGIDWLTESVEDVEQEQVKAILSKYINDPEMGYMSKMTGEMDMLAKMVYPDHDMKNVLKMVDDEMMQDEMAAAAMEGGEMEMGKDVFTEDEGGEVDLDLDVEGDVDGGLDDGTNGDFVDENTPGFETGYGEGAGDVDETDQELLDRYDVKRKALMKKSAEADALLDELEGMKNVPGLAKYKIRKYKKKLKEEGVDELLDDEVPGPDSADYFEKSEDDLEEEKTFESEVLTDGEEKECDDDYPTKVAKSANGSLNGLDAEQIARLDSIMEKRMELDQLTTRTSY